MIYSIIIPHKNVPDLLERLLNSIPVREDTEIIIVDDHSDKEKVNFDLFPGLNRKNTKVIFLDDSKGAGYARNLGISKASGKWLLFADADDFYTKKLSFVLDKYSEIDDVDMVYLNAQFFYESTQKTVPISFNKYFVRFEKRKWYSESILRYYMWTPWTRMVKRSLVEDNGLEYEQIPTGNDKMFSLKCSKYAQKIKVESMYIYNYCMADNKSVTFSYSIKPEVLKTKIDLLFRTNDFYKEVGFLFKSSLLYEYIANYRNNQIEPRKSIFKEAFRRKDYHAIIDIWRLIKYILAKALNIL